MLLLEKEGRDACWRGLCRVLEAGRPWVRDACWRASPTSSRARAARGKRRGGVGLRGVCLLPVYIAYY